jgi:hypothetical protein
MIKAMDIDPNPTGETPPTGMETRLQTHLLIELAVPKPTKKNGLGRGCRGEASSLLFWALIS